MQTDSSRVRIVAKTGFCAFCGLLKNCWSALRNSFLQATMEEIAAANGLLELNRGVVSSSAYELVNYEFLDEFQLDAAADCKRALRSCSSATHFPFPHNQQACVRPAPLPVMIPVSDSSSLQAVVASSVQSSRHKNDDYHHQMAQAKLLPAAAARSPGFLFDEADYYLHHQQQQPALASVDDMIIEDKSALQSMEPCFLLPDNHVLMMDKTAAAAQQEQAAAAGFSAFPEEQKVFAAAPLAAPDMFQAVPAAFAAGGAAPTGVSFPLPLCWHDARTEEMLAAASFCDAMVADECWTSLMDDEGAQEQQPSSVWNNVQYADYLPQQQQQQNQASCSTRVMPATLVAGADPKRQATLLWILQQQQEQRQREEQLNKILQQQQEQRQREEQLNRIFPAAPILPPAANAAANAPPIAAAEGTTIQAEANRSTVDHLVQRCSMQQQEQDEKPRASRLQDFQTAYESALRNNQVIDLDALQDDDDDQSDSASSSSSESEETLPVLPELREHRDDTDTAASSSWGGLRNDPDLVLASCATGIKLSDKELVKTLRSKRSSSSCVAACPAVLNIAEVDVYADHPARLLNQQGAWMGYFFSKAKYCNFARPTRSRLTIEGCRWKQQGPSLPIRVDGDVVAYKTYLSFVSLKNTSADDRRSSSSGSREAFLSIQKNHHGFKRSRKCSRYTMEEIVLREDKELELAMLNSGRKPPPFDVLCRVSQKTEVGIPRAIPIPSAVLHQRGCGDEVTIAFGDRSRLTFQVSPIEEMLECMAEAEEMPCCPGELYL